MTKLSEYLKKFKGMETYRKNIKTNVGIMFDKNLIAYLPLPRIYLWVPSLLQNVVIGL